MLAAAGSFALAVGLVAVPAAVAAPATRAVPATRAAARTAGPSAFARSRSGTRASAGPAQSGGSQSGPESADAAAGQASTLALAARKMTGSAARKRVSYRGYTFWVPKSWPVINDGGPHPQCVRFDQHAVYLGAVNSGEFCPSWLLGTTESMLIQPGPARAARSSTENPVARQISVRAPGIVITATFDTKPRVIDRILASAALPVPKIVRPDPLRSASAPAGRSAAAAAATQQSGASRLVGPAPAIHYPMAAPALPTTVISYHGLGFDACAAPGERYMTAWRRHSPYRAIGIYIGGADRACAQPHLTQAWVRTEALAGWRFIPLYAGPQAAFGEIRHPASQGTAAASDAVAQARGLGFGPRTPIYYDMEAYLPKDRLTVLQFLSAWTIELHRLGYFSGVYSSSDSGIVDLARQDGGHKYAMPNIIYDALWNGAANVRDGNLRAGEWPNHQRIHQFSGNVTQTFGGATINIDRDYLDVRVTQPAGTGQPSTAVAVRGGAIDLFYRGGDHSLWFDQYRPGRGWGRPARTGSQAYSTPSAVWTGSSVDVFYRSRYGRLWEDTYRPDGRRTGQHRLVMMGVIGWGPRAVVQSGGVIDVFWRGSADDHLWHGQYTPGQGWNGPQGLGGSLSSTPSPVVSAPGVTVVFWKGTDNNLWRVTRNLSGRWTAPADLGMGPLGGAPRATAQASGGMEIYWKGSGNADLWEGFYQPGLGWRGPRDLGGTVRSVPWPVSATGTVQVLWRGAAHRLRQVAHVAGKGWNDAGWFGPVTAPVGWVGPAVFSSVGGSGRVVQVLWTGRRGRLWAAVMTTRGWSRPVRIATGVTAP
ncbi:MAG: glycoside hydrolase domain-containing protein [Streptosporangiaceae bacterium]